MILKVRSPITYQTKYSSVQAKYAGGASRTIFEPIREYITKNPIDEKVLDLLLEVA